MTWQEFQQELTEVPLAKIPSDRLGDLLVFPVPESATAMEREQHADAKVALRQEMVRRNHEQAMREDSMHRRQDSQRAVRQHLEHLTQSERLHTAQMERAHASFVFHRRSVWIAAAIAILSALFCWGSLWRQRRETRESIEPIMKRLDDLELRVSKMQQPPEKGTAPESRPASAK